MMNRFLALAMFFFVTAQAQNPLVLLMGEDSAPTQYYAVELSGTAEYASKSSLVSGYNLSEAEITTAMSSGLSASYGGGTVVAWYKWSGSDDATMLQDYSASGNDLTGNNVTQADDQVLIGTSYK